MLRVLFLLLVIFINIFGLKYTTYLNRFQEYSPLAFLAVLLYLFSIFLRSFTYARAKKRETIILFVYHGLLAPFFFYAIDFFLILRWVIKKDGEAITNFLSVRIYELLFLLIALATMGFIINPMTEMIFIALCLYALFSFVFLYLKKKLSFDPRIIFFSFISMTLLLFSLILGKYVLMESWQFIDFNDYYFPVIEDTMRLSHFSHLIISVFLLSSALIEPKRDEQ